MKKYFTSLALCFLFMGTKLSAQLNIKVKVESISVQNSLDCDAGTSDNSDFLIEYRATDNSAAQLTNNATVIGSIGNCNFVYLTENNGPYTVSTNTPGLAVFSPTNGVFFDHSYNCYQNIPTTLLFTWRGYENDDSFSPSITPNASGITAINTASFALPSNVTTTVLTVQYSATSPDAICDQTYVIKFSVSISTGSFYPLYIEHTHENIICPGGNNGTVEVHPAGGSGTVSIDWSNDGVGDFDDLAIANGLGVGSYTVILKDDLNCRDTAVAIVTSIPAPTAITGFIQSKSNLCKGTSTIYEVPSQTNASLFSWQYSGSGATFSSNTTSIVSVAFSSTATSGVLSVYAVNSCSVSPTLTLNITVSDIPNLVINGNTQVCDNNNATTLTASGALTYTWNGGATTSTLAISPNVTTVYSLIGSNNGCNSLNDFTVSVLSSPTVVVSSSSSTICPNENIQLIATGNGNLFLWSDGFVGSTHTVIPNVSTIYTVTNTYTNSCYGQNSVSVYVKPTPTITISGNTMSCPNQSITLTASGIDTYTWSNGYNSAIISFTPNGVSTLSLKGTDALTNCSNTKTISIGNFTLNPITILGSPIICSQYITTYTASGFDYYLWNNGATAATNTLMVTGPTTIQVVGTTLNGCKDSTMLALNVTQTPTVTISAVDSVCAGQSTILVASIIGATSYSWSTGANTTSISVAPISNSTYTFTAINGGCSNIMTRKIGVKQIPLINFAINPVVCSTAQTLTLNATPIGGIYNGINVSGNVFNPSLPNGAYSISYFFIGNNGCQASSSQTINVVYCVGIEELDNANATSLYPNPATTDLRLVNTKDAVSFEMFDYTGKIILSDKVHENDTTISVNNLVDGMYSIRVNLSNGKQEVLRFIKQ